MPHEACNLEIHGGFTRDACLFWLSFMSPSATYFEWGSGFTTVASNNMGVRMTSIEGSKQWYDSMIRSNKFKETTNLTYVDIGYTGDFSWPKDRTKGTRYIEAIRDKPWHDVVLVDGRFRVACALAAFDRTNQVLVHDFERKHYHLLLKVYKKVEERDTLALLAPNQSVDIQYVRELLAKEMTNPER